MIAAAMAGVKVTFMMVIEGRRSASTGDWMAKVRESRAIRLVGAYGGLVICEGMKSGGEEGPPFELSGRCTDDVVGFNR